MRSPASGWRDFSQALPQPRVSHTDRNAELAKLLATMGCPKTKAHEMAVQLAKRSRQLAKERNISCDETMTHLLNLMRQGWAAKEQPDAN